MYIYLLHSFVLYPFRETGVLGGHPSVAWLAAVVLACIGVSIALASPFVRRLFRPLIEPKPNWLFIPPGRRRSRPVACRPDRVAATRTAAALSGTRGEVDRITAYVSLR